MNKCRINLALIAIMTMVVAMARAEDKVENGTVVNEKSKVSDELRGSYLVDAKKYEFYHDQNRKEQLDFVAKPVMRWANDDEWSGDVFVWSHHGLPEVIGCTLSGPISDGSMRFAFHEFHLLSDRPIAAADLHTKRRWQSKEGLARTKVPEGPEPAKSAAGRLTQMRQMSRRFSAHMDADGEWELRLLTQPLLRYGNDEKPVVDGALFAYVWTKGTDPEVMLMFECRKTDDRLIWHYAPIRFSNRAVWLTLDSKETWRVEPHREPEGGTTSLPYTTAYAHVMSKSATTQNPEP